MGQPTQELALPRAAVPPRTLWQDKLDLQEFTLGDRFAIFGGVLRYAAGARTGIIPRHAASIRFRAEGFAGPARPWDYAAAALFHCFLRPDL